jgi:hypothetical protein
MSADERPLAANDLGRNTHQAMRQEADAVTKWLRRTMEPNCSRIIGSRMVKGEGSTTENRPA